MEKTAKKDTRGGREGGNSVRKAKEVLQRRVGPTGKWKRVSSADYGRSRI